MKRSNIVNNYKKGQELISKNRLDDALKIFLEISSIDKKSSNIQLTIAQIYRMKNDLINSKIHIKKSIKLNPRNATALNNLGNIYLAQFDPINAEKCFLKSIFVDKNYSLPNFNLATIYRTRGDLEKAKIFYKKAISLDDENFEFIYHLNNLDPKSVTKEQSKFVEHKLNTDNNFSYLNKASGHFFLAEKNRVENTIKNEMKHLKIAHEHFLESDKNLKKIIYYWLAIVPNFNDKIILDEKNYEKPDISPIFITGLPRSGTTLVESIITSGNSYILNGGETGVLNKSLVLLKKKEFFNKDFIKDDYRVSINLQSLKEQVILLYKEQKLTRKLFTDKSLENVFFTDIILKLFPNAKIINCERNNFDNLVGIYQQYLPKMAWSHSIKNIIKYMENNMKSSKYFKLKYPDNFFTINLEELTNDPVKVSKDLMNFCNLDWSIKVLDFYKRKDLNTKTASNVQIRKKIYKYDKKRFNLYRSYFENYIKNTKINF